METILEGGLKFKAVVYFHTAPQNVNSPILKYVIKDAGSPILKS